MSGNKQGTWGQFGDYVGGVLNPVFALFAFLAVLYNSRLQQEQLLLLQAQHEEDRERLRTESASQTNVNLRDELTKVLSVIEDSIDKLLNEPVTKSNDPAKFLLLHMALEGERLSGTKPLSPAYAEYISQARSAGSIINAMHIRLIKASSDLARFVLLLQASSPQNSPFVKFYRLRYAYLFRILQDVGAIPPDVLAFFDKANQELSSENRVLVTLGT
jgi:hypothetical protein